jgi:hypothetical protein
LVRSKGKTQELVKIKKIKKAEVSTVDIGKSVDKIA